jgi:molybdenum cofactor cytidylyltransferase
VALSGKVDFRERFTESSTEVNFTAIILAAGASRRMGTPKALLEFQGRTFIDGLTDAFARHCSTVIIVVGEHGDAIRAGMRLRNRAVFVVNPAPENGQLSSLQCALRAVPEDVSGILFMPVDSPAVRPETIGRLIERSKEAAFVVPEYQGRHGHPILFRPEIASEFLALPAGSTAREVVHRYRSDTLYIDVQDPGVARDIDDPTAYRDLLAAERL